MEYSEMRINAVLESINELFRSRYNRQYTYIFYSCGRFTLHGDSFIDANKKLERFLKYNNVETIKKYLLEIVGDIFEKWNIDLNDVEFKWVVGNASYSFTLGN